MESIVVGITKADDLECLLEYAAREAALRRALLRVVCVWELTAGEVRSLGARPSLEDEFSQPAERLVSEAITRIRQLQPGVRCEASVIRGDWARALLDESRNASLVVIGSDERHKVILSLPGSPRQQRMARKAGCPVTIVPKR